MSRVPGSHVRFEHEGPNRQIILRDYTDEDRVEPSGMVTVRQFLDAWGFMEKAKFDEQVRRLKASG